MLWRRRKQHRPAAERNVGFAALKGYAIGAAFALVWLLIFGTPEIVRNALDVASIINPTIKQEVEKTAEDTAQSEEQSDRPPSLATLEQQAQRRYPMPQRPRGVGDWTGNAGFKWREDYAQKMREIQAVFKEWEQETGRDFLRDHWTMKPAPSYIERPKIKPATADVINGNFPTGTLNKLLSAESVRNAVFGHLKRVYAGRATAQDVSECKAENREIERQNRNRKQYNGFTHLNQPDTLYECKDVGDPQGMPQEYTRRVNELNGLCVMSVSNADKPHTAERYYYSYQALYECGEVWRNFARAVYTAQTTRDFWQASPFARYALAEEQRHNGAGERYRRAVAEVEDKRRAWIAMQQIEQAPQNATRTPEISFTSKPEGKPAAPLAERLKSLTTRQIDAIRFWMLGGALLCVFVYVYAGSRYSAFTRPPWLPESIYFAAVPFALVYGVTFYIDPREWLDSATGAAFAFAVPFGFMIWPLGKLVAVENFKDHPLYRRLFILGRGGEKARLASVRDFIRKDFSGWLQANRYGIARTHESKTYLGRTLFENDFRIGGRDVGLKTDHHLLTIAGTGAGKSRDAVWNTLLSYAGGFVGFDPKGEHVRVTYARRAAYSKAYVLDPFGEVSDVVKSSHWNPLDEIDPTSPAARDEILRLAEASIYPESNEGASSSHFRETAQIILRGFIAHVLTTFPEGMRHLGTVYDLIKTGDPTGENYSPKGMQKLLIEMMTNKAIAGSPRDAANLLDNVGDRERGSLLSTIARAIDWINSEAVRPIITQKSDFSVREAKSREASIYLVLPESYIGVQIRFVRTFYSLCFDKCDNFNTPQPQGSQRRVLFLFDEFYRLGHFRQAQDAILTKRSSYLKCWFILQNLGQLHELYGNVDNFLGSCDKQFFGLHKMDDTALNLIESSLGQYTKDVYTHAEQAPEQRTYSVMPRSDIAEFLDKEARGQIVIPLGGRVMKLKRIPYTSNYPRKAYGER